MPWEVLDKKTHKDMLPRRLTSYCAGKWVLLTSDGVFFTGELSQFTHMPQGIVKTTSRFSEFLERCVLTGQTLASYCFQVPAWHI